MRKNNNPLKIRIRSCRTSYYLTHPWKYIHDIYWSIRNFFHRGRYGFAYSDVWNWYAWWTTVGAEALRYMAEHGSGYPGVEPWETPDKWSRYLNSIACNLDWARDTCDICPEHHNHQNEFYPEVKEIRTRTNVDRIKMTPQDADIVKKYWDREEELSKADSDQCAKIFAEIGRNLGRFWD